MRRQQRKTNHVRIIDIRSSARSPTRFLCYEAECECTIGNSFEWSRKNKLIIPVANYQKTLKPQQIASNSHVAEEIKQNIKITIITVVGVCQLFLCKTKVAESWLQMFSRLHPHIRDKSIMSDHSPGLKLMKCARDLCIHAHTHTSTHSYAHLGVLFRIKIDSHADTPLLRIAGCQAKLRRTVCKQIPIKFRYN